MKICLNCNREFENDSLIECPICGEILDEEDEESEL